ncbi:MAG: hypothetical protein N2439_07805, partial [Anaerolineae bacterium]|nr:hypothetical protein [Anaerolineae bacterium]
RNPIPLDALLAPPAVYDVARDNNNVGDRIGLVQSVLLFLALPAAGVAWRRRRARVGPLIAATLTGWFLFWLLTAASDGLWHALPLLGRLLYRTRLMGAQALFAALSAGLLIALWPSRGQRWGGLVLSILFVGLALPSLYVELQHRYAVFHLPLDLAQVRAAEIRTHGTALTAFGEFTPRWRTAAFDDVLLAGLGPDFDPQARPLADPPSGVQLLASRVRHQAWDLRIAAAEPLTLTLHLLYYPRWQGTVDGQPVPLTPQAQTGYVQLSVPAGTHDIALRYGSTPAETIGLALRAATLLRLLMALTGLLICKFACVDRYTTWLRCVSTAERVCGAQATVDIAFTDAPRLRGYTVSSSDVRRGAEVRVDLYWQGEPTAARRLASFVHIRRSRPEQAPSPITGGDIWAQAEHSTPAGLLTTEFLPGKLYKDEFRVRIPADMPPGEYFLEVGWFDPATGEQLDPLPETVKPPLQILWRSVLLPSVRVQ